MKIEYEVGDEEFETLYFALNNGFISLQATYFCLTLGCQVPTAFEPLQDKYNVDELETLATKRLKAFKNFYKYIEQLASSK